MKKGNWLKNIWITAWTREIHLGKKMNTMWTWAWNLASFTILFCLAIMIITFVISMLASFSEIASETTNIKDKTVWLNVIGAIAASLVGAYAAVYFSLSTQRKIDRKKEQDKLNFGMKTIMTFIKPEITLNYNILGLSDSMPSIIFGKGNLRTGEYEKIKYSLIEYPSEIVSKIVELYEMFDEWNRLPNILSGDNKTEQINKILVIKRELDRLFQDIEKGIK